mmetsp:Transcript_13691/g.15013  ORF Transcript_13691/g.15013 Transcript_13691/m.15013 type:complete len:93 (+) Transcript_13691:1-279(+)
MNECVPYAAHMPNTNGGAFVCILTPPEDPQKDRESTENAEYISIYSRYKRRYLSIGSSGWKFAFTSFLFYHLFYKKRCEVQHPIRHPPPPTI